MWSRPQRLLRSPDVDLAVRQSAEFETQTAIQRSGGPIFSK